MALQKFDISNYFFNNVSILKYIKNLFNNRYIKLDIMEISYNIKINLLNKVILINKYPSEKDLDYAKKSIYKFDKINKKLKLTFGNGADELILILILLSKKRIGYFKPSFSMYERYCITYNKKKIPFILNKKFNIDNKIINKIKNNIKSLSIFFICNPNNPTGNLLNNKLIKKILKYPKCLFIIDETYYYYSKFSYINYILKCPNVIIIRTLSKIGFAGIRFGYLIGNKKIINYIDKCKPPFNISILNINIIKNLNKYKKKIILIINKIIKERKILYKFFIKKKIKIYKSKCNFYIIKTKNPTEIYKILYNNKIIIKIIKDILLRITIGNKLENTKLINIFKRI